MTQLPVKSKKGERSIVASRFLTSDRAEDIFDIIHEQRGKVTMAELYRRVKKVDPTLPSYVSFCKFLRKLDRDESKRANVLLEKLKNTFENEENIGEAVLKKLLNNAYHKIFVMGDIVMDQTIRDIQTKLENDEPLTIKERKLIMDWFFKGSKAFAEHRSIDLKIKADERVETLMENLITAAQYGHTSPKDIVDGEFEEVEPNKLEEKSNAAA